MFHNLIMMPFCIPGFWGNNLKTKFWEEHFPLSKSHWIVFETIGIWQEHSMYPFNFAQLSIFLILGIGTDSEEDIPDNSG